jgi:enediyne biosynthesis protein E4
MSIGAKRKLLTVAFVGLLLGPAVYFRMTSQEEATQAATSEEQQKLLARYGFLLRESAEAAGIDFVHEPPRLDKRLDHIAPQIAAMGAAVSVVDFDRDGWQDFYVTNSAPGSRNRLYRNNRDGTFTDVAAEVGLGGLKPPGDRRLDGLDLGRHR